MMEANSTQHPRANVVFACCAALLVTVLCVYGVSAAQRSSAASDGSHPDKSDDDTFSSYRRVTKRITAPKATHAPDPQYPDLPPDTEPRGLVVMLIGVDARGHVGPVRVLRSSAPAFENSAVQTVKKWKFKPAKEDGKAVSVQITVEMKFER